MAACFEAYFGKVTSISGTAVLVYICKKLCETDEKSFVLSEDNSLLRYRHYAQKVICELRTEFILCQESFQWRIVLELGHHLVTFLPRVVGKRRI